MFLPYEFKQDERSVFKNERIRTSLHLDKPQYEIMSPLLVRRPKQRKTPVEFKSESENQKMLSLLSSMR